LQTDAAGFVRKVAYIDLTKIANPQRLAKIGPNEASFALPHLGPEGLTIVDSKHIVLVNDNNFPYSSGRTIGKPDDNEFTLLNIEALVNAKWPPAVQPASRHRNKTRCFFVTHWRPA
jgi:hypothetical protein